MNQHKIFKVVAGASFLLLILSISTGVEDYREDFEGISPSSFPDPWNRTNSSCPSGGCEGYGMVTNNNTRTMECLERTSGMRYCYFEVDVEPGSNISMDYRLHVSASDSLAEIVVFRNNSGYNRLDLIARLRTLNTNMQQTSSGSLTYDLSNWAGSSVLLGARVSGKGNGAGESYVQMDNISLRDGGASAAPTDMEKKVKDYDSTDPLVMGRKVNSSYSYEIEKVYRPVDTALVIDSSGSMDPWGSTNYMDDVKQAAKSYVESTNVAKGDKNGVVEFDDQASILQGLTSSKADAKNAIDQMTAGGSTNTGEGIEKGIQVLESGNNPIQALIVLADGKTNTGPNPGTVADQARDKGIQVHGIMFGDGADTGEFEAITNSSECKKSGSENSDGDNCWYAKPGTIDSVYQDIREELTVKRSANLWMSLPGYTYPLSGYDYNVSSGSRELFVREDINISAGNHTESFIWAPLDYGDDEVIDNDESLIQYTEGDETTNYTYDRRIVRDVRYVDFSIPRYSLRRTVSGVKLSFDVENTGTALSLSRNTSLIDNSSNKVKNYTVPRLGSGSNTSFTDHFPNDHLYFDNLQPLNLTVDPRGVWDSRLPGKGATLEPDETDNTVTLGYPAEREGIGPSSLTWNKSFRFWIEVAHPQPSKLEAYFSYTKNGTVINSSDRMFKAVKGNRINFSTQEILPNTSEVFYNFSVRILDSRGAISVYNRSYYVKDPPPQVTAVNPPDGGLISGFPVNLKVRVEDRSTDDINVSFYSGRKGTLIYNESYVDNGSEVSTSWTPADPAETYYSWIVNATDNHSTSTTTFTFRKATGRLYRNEIIFEMNYSSIVMTAGENRIVQLNVTNNVLSSKNITLRLKGVKAEFLDGSTSKKIYDFPPLSSKTFTVRLSPGNQTDEDLTVISHDNELGINTQKTLPVIALPQAAVTKDVPGLQIVQLIALLASATVLYSVRL